MNDDEDPVRANRPSMPDAPARPPALTPMARRRFLARSASLMASASASLLLGHREATAVEQDTDPMRVPGLPARSYGGRSSFESISRSAGDSHSLTPLQDLHGVVTPSSLHFERHHNGVPAIDPSRHRVLVHGLVARPVLFTLDDLQRFPSVSRLAFIECAGNSRQEWRDAQDHTVQELHGLTSTSEWTGVKLATLLEAAGLRPEAAWVLAEGGDAAGVTRSVPLTGEVLSD